MSNNKILDIFRTLVDGYHDIRLTSGEVLQSSTSKVDAMPSLVWSVSGWNTETWQSPYKYLIKWDIPAKLTIQGESGKPDALLGAINDIDDWSSFVYGLPLDSDGKVVPYGTVRYFQLERLNQLYSIAERFVGPYISKVQIQPDVADSSFAWCNLIFHVEFISDATPKTDSVARFFQIGANILYPNHANNITKIGDPYTLPQPADSDIRAQGGFAKPDTLLTIAGAAGVEVDGGFPPLASDIPSVAGTGDPIKEITILPGSSRLVISSTIQLSAILFRESGIGELDAFTWNSTNPTAATVDQTGLVTTLALGTTTISASYGGVTGSATFTVVTYLNGRAVFTGAENGNTVPWPTISWNGSISTAGRVVIGIPVITGSLSDASPIVGYDPTTMTIRGVLATASDSFIGYVDYLAFSPALTVLS